MKNELEGLYSAEELNAIVHNLFSHITGLTASLMIIERERKLTESEIYFLQRSLKRLKQQEPLQYITGIAHFRGLEFKVNSSVLIPRPETEELVGWVVEEAGLRMPKAILDIGTGSGCIAISIKKEHTDTSVYALDVSPEALTIAEENAANLGADITFYQADILNKDACTSLPHFDVIVSNPPYVTPADREKMQKNVTDYEPGLALFVEEDDPLIFYRAIIDFSIDHLNKSGKLFFECNESNADEVVALLKKGGFDDVELRSDMRGKERMVLGVGDWVLGTGGWD